MRRAVRSSSGTTLERLVIYIWTASDDNISIIFDTHGAQATGIASRITDDEKIDALVRMNTELLSELWIMRDRMMVLEHLLEKKSGLSRQEIDDFEPPPDLEAELLAERDALVRRVVGAPWNDHWTVESIVKNKGR